MFTLYVDVHPFPGSFGWLDKVQCSGQDSTWGHSLDAGNDPHTAGTRVHEERSVRVPDLRCWWLPVYKYPNLILFLPYNFAQG